MKKLLVLLLLMTGCSNARLVAKVAASETYYAASYRAKCQNTGGTYSDRCAPCRAILNDSIWQVQTAQTNRDIGYMPPQEIVELEELLDSLDTCP